MSARTDPRGVHVWDRTFRLWDTYFAIVWLATLVFVLGTAQPAWPVRLAAAALLVLLVPLYVSVGRPVLMTEGVAERRAVTYIAAAVAVYMVPGVLVGETRLMAFALVPQCFIALRYRRAMIAVTVINIAPVVGWALLWDISRQDLFFNSVFAVVTLVFSAAFGGWTIRIMDQSQERAELIAELDASREEVAQLSADRGALAERERLSREIHDTLAQGFTSVLMLIQAVDAELDHDVPRARRHLALMADTARQNLAEARALVAGGAPADLDGASLPDALHRVASRHGALVRVLGEARPLAPGLEVVALRGCQEALANVHKHAPPDTPIQVELAYGEADLTLVVRDTGPGFDPAEATDGFGLRGLRARAAEVGGTATVTSAPGAGTTVTVRLPAPERTLT
ncbi:sensor histidine kinase [Streptomyces sp. VRA16 Mangrove soil]|uniref:sensor histidine kinase n=1 Tax=Streptomyces sp. VRA16 Mangrove soil TaxID=2817434 RepID=UPI0027DAC0FA|nr:sensor histidine kinase [Streptomyces sp. VRA16 Mangrove soil]